MNYVFPKEYQCLPMTPEVKKWMLQVLKTTKQSSGDSQMTIFGETYTTGAESLSQSDKSKGGRVAESVCAHVCMRAPRGEQKLWKQKGNVCRKWEK